MDVLEPITNPDARSLIWRTGTQSRGGQVLGRLAGDGRRSQFLVEFLGMDSVILHSNTTITVLYEKQISDLPATAANLGITLEEINTMHNEELRRPAARPGRGETQDEGQMIMVSLILKNTRTGELIRRSVMIAKGSTPIDAVGAAFENTIITNHELGRYVRSINGLGERRGGWGLQFYINGRLPCVMIEPIVGAQTQEGYVFSLQKKQAEYFAVLECFRRRQAAEMLFAGAANRLNCESWFESVWGRLRVGGRINAAKETEHEHLGWKKRRCGTCRPECDVRQDFAEKSSEWFLHELPTSNWYVAANNQAVKEGNGFQQNSCACQATMTAKETLSGAYTQLRHETVDSVLTRLGYVKLDQNIKNVTDARVDLCCGGRVGYNYTETESEIEIREEGAAGGIASRSRMALNRTPEHTTQENYKIKNPIFEVVGLGHRKRAKAAISTSGGGRSDYERADNCDVFGCAKLLVEEFEYVGRVVLLAGKSTTKTRPCKNGLLSVVGGRMQNQGNAGRQKQGFSSKSR